MEFLYWIFPLKHAEQAKRKGEPVEWVSTNNVANNVDYHLAKGKAFWDRETTVYHKTVILWYQCQSSKQPRFFDSKWFGWLQVTVVIWSKILLQVTRLMRYTIKVKVIAVISSKVWLQVAVTVTVVKPKWQNLNSSTWIFQVQSSSSCC